MIIEDEILVLKEVKYNDNDKILHAISKKNGKLQIISRGCRKTKSPLINISQIMAYSKCELYLSRDMYIINSGDLISSFYNIRYKIYAFLYGNYILEVLDYISQENEVDSKVFDMTIKFFSVLDTIDDNSELIENLVSVYELKLISILGYRPQLKGCILCGEIINSETNYYFSIEDGGIQCSNCTNSNVKLIKLSINELIVLNNILRLKLDDIDLLKSLNENINSLIKRYMFHYIGKSNFTTLKFLKKGDIYV